MVLIHTELKEIIFVWEHIKYLSKNGAKWWTKISKG